MLIDFTARATHSELMDDPDCNGTLLLRTVCQFASINRLVGRYRTILRREVLVDMQREPEREYHLLDMGAGGCDIDAWLLTAARNLGLKLRITACDIDERIIAYARSNYGNVPGLKVVYKDLLADPINETVDYVFANHFLHHLSNGQITTLLKHWYPLVRRKMVFSDLLRSPGSYCGYALLSLFYPHSFARTDGLISIRRGFRPAELVGLAENAGFVRRSRVQHYHPGRLVLTLTSKPE